MARCCGSAGTCACKIEAGRNMLITGSGTSQDPFIAVADVYLSVQDSPHFDMGLSGTGTLENPWTLSVDYVTGTGLSGLPDVSDTAPLTGQVLGWDGSRWKPVAPTTASAGDVLTDSSLTGDGSSGSLLQVKEDPDRYLGTTTAGVGLSDAGIARMLRIYPDTTTRANDDIAPEQGTLSTRQNNLGRYDYWDGASWQPITNGVQVSVATGQMMQMSGPYVTNSPITEYIGQVAATTDASGDFDIIGTAPLSGYAGVLSCHFQLTGTTAATVMARGDVNRIRGRAFRADTGAPYTGYAVTGTVRALLY